MPTGRLRIYFNTMHQDTKYIRKKLSQDLLVVAYTVFCFVANASHRYGSLGHVLYLFCDGNNAR